MIMRADMNRNITVHAFLLLCWNLMARAVSVASIRYDHVSWEGKFYIVFYSGYLVCTVVIIVFIGDALIVQYGRMKNDQDGSACMPRHVYANPMDPEICPILGYIIQY
jgi:hypothetical protein